MSDPNPTELEIIPLGEGNTNSNPPEQPLRPVTKQSSDVGQTAEGNAEKSADVVLPFIESDEDDETKPQHKKLMRSLKNFGNIVLDTNENPRQRAANEAPPPGPTQTTTTTTASGSHSVSKEQNRGEIPLYDFVYHLMQDVWCAPLNWHHRLPKGKYLVSATGMQASIRLWGIRTLLVVISLLFFGALLSYSNIQYEYFFGDFSDTMVFKGRTEVSVADCYVDMHVCGLSPGFTSVSAELYLITEAKDVHSYYFRSNSLKGCRISLCMPPLDAAAGGTLVVTVDKVSLLLRNIPSAWNISVVSFSDSDSSRVILSNTSGTVDIASGIVILDRLSKSNVTEVRNRFGPVYVLGGSNADLPQIAMDNDTTPTCIDRHLSKNGGAGSAMVRVIDATSLYVLSVDSVDSDLIDNGLNLTNITMSPSTLTSLNDTDLWIKGFANGDFIQNIEVIAPMIGFNLLNSNRELLFSFGPVVLATVSLFVLSPTYRKLATPLNHYGCRTIVNYDRLGSLTNSYSRMDATEMARYFSEPIPLQYVYSVMQDTQNIMSVDAGFPTSVTVYVPLDRGTFEVPRRYVVNRVFEKYEVAEVQPKVMGMLVLVASILVALTEMFIVIFVLLRFRREIAQSLLLYKERSRVRMLASVDPGLCTYHNTFSYSFMCGWGSLLFMYIVDSIYVQWFGEEDSVVTFFLSFVQRSPQDRVPIDSFMKHLRNFLFVTLRSPEKSTSDDTFLSDVLRMQNWHDGRPVKIGYEEIPYVTGITSKLGATKAMQTAFNRKFCVTNVLSDAVSLHEIVGDSLMDEVAVLAEADLLQLRVIKKRTLVIKQACLMPLTSDNIDAIARLHEYNCSGFPLAHPLRFTAVSYKTSTEGDALKVNAYRSAFAVGIFIAQAVTYLALTTLPFVLTILGIVNIQVENLKYSSMSTTIDLNHFLWVLYVPQSMEDRGYQYIPYIFVPICAIYILEPVISEVWSIFVAGARFRPSVAYMLMASSLAVRFCALVGAGSLVAILVFWGCLASMWWILGAIISPNVMLPFATASLTFIFTAITLVTGLKNKRETIIAQLEEKVMKKVLDKFRSCPIHLPIGDAGKSGSSDSEGLASTSSKIAGEAMALASQINTDLLTDLRRMKPEAIQKLANIACIPPEVAQLCVLVGMQDGGDRFQDTLKMILAKLDLPPSARSLTIAAAVMVLDGSVPPNITREVFESVVPVEFHPYLGFFNSLIKRCTAHLVEGLRLGAALATTISDEASGGLGDLKKEMSMVQESSAAVLNNISSKVSELKASEDQLMEAMLPLALEALSGVLQTTLKSDAKTEDLARELFAVLNELSTVKKLNARRLLGCVARVLFALNRSCVLPENTRPFVSLTANMCKKISEDIGFSDTISFEVDMLELIRVVLKKIPPSSYRKYHDKIAALKDFTRSYFGVVPPDEVEESVRTIIDTDWHALLKLIAQFHMPDYIAEFHKLRNEVENALQTGAATATPRAVAIIRFLRELPPVQVAMNELNPLEDPTVKKLIQLFELLEKLAGREFLRFVIVSPLLRKMFPPAIHNAIFLASSSVDAITGGAQITDPTKVPFLPTSGNTVLLAKDADGDLIPSSSVTAKSILFEDRSLLSKVRIIDIINLTPYRFGHMINPCTVAFQKFVLSEVTSALSLRDEVEREVAGAEKELTDAVSSLKDESQHKKRLDELLCLLLLAPWRQKVTDEREEELVRKAVKYYTAGKNISTAIMDGNGDLRFIDDLVQLIPFGKDDDLRRAVQFFLSVFSTAKTAKERERLMLSEARSVATTTAVLRRLKHAGKTLIPADIEAMLSFEVAAGDIVKCLEKLFRLIETTIDDPFTIAEIEEKLIKAMPMAAEIKQSLQTAKLNVQLTAQSIPSNDQSALLQGNVLAGAQLVADNVEGMAKAAVAAVGDPCELLLKVLRKCPQIVCDFSVLMLAKKNCHEETVRRVVEFLFPSCSLMCLDIWRSITTGVRDPCIDMVRRKGVGANIAKALFSLALVKCGSPGAPVERVISHLIAGEYFDAWCVFRDELEEKFDDAFFQQLSGPIPSVKTLAMLKSESHAFMDHILSYFTAEKRDEKKLIVEVMQNPACLFKQLKDPLHASIANFIAAVCHQNKTEIIRTATGLTREILRKTNVVANEPPSIHDEEAEELLSTLFGSLIAMVFSVATKLGTPAQKATAGLVVALRGGASFLSTLAARKDAPEWAGMILLSYVADAVETIAVERITSLPVPRLWNIATKMASKASEHVEIVKKKKKTTVETLNLAGVTDVVKSLLTLLAPSQPDLVDEMRWQELTFYLNSAVNKVLPTDCKLPAVLHSELLMNDPIKALTGLSNGNFGGDVGGFDANAMIAGGMTSLAGSHMGAMLGGIDMGSLGTGYSGIGGGSSATAENAAQGTFAVGNFSVGSARGGRNAPLAGDGNNGGASDEVVGRSSNDPAAVNAAKAPKKGAAGGSGAASSPTGGGAITIFNNGSSRHYNNNDGSGATANGGAGGSSGWGSGGGNSRAKTSVAQFQRLLSTSLSSKMLNPPSREGRRHSSSAAQNEGEEELFPYEDDEDTDDLDFNLEEQLENVIMLLAIAADFMTKPVVKEISRRAKEHGNVDIDPQELAANLLKFRSGLIVITRAMYSKRMNRMEKLESVLLVAIDRQVVQQVRGIVMAVLDCATGDFGAVPKLLEHLGITIPIEVQEKIILPLNLLKKLSDGTLDMGLVVESSAVALIDKIADELFTQVDFENKGYISFDRFFSLIKHMGIGISEADAKEAFTKVDTTGDGIIDKLEFRKGVDFLKKAAVEIVIDKLHFRKAQLAVFIISVILFLLFFLSFILLGMAVFSDGSVFTAVVGGAMPVVSQGINFFYKKLDGIISQAEEILNAVF